MYIKNFRVNSSIFFYLGIEFMVYNLRSVYQVKVIQLQGDKRKNVSTFLVQAGTMKKEHVKIHCF